jgi:branched-chain amino acid aminotransferase
MSNIYLSASILVFHLAAGKDQAVNCSLDPPPTSLDEACRNLPDGAYTTLRTYKGRKALRLEDHFNRLEDSARQAGVQIELDRVRLRQALRQLIGHNSPGGDCRIRVVLDLEAAPGDLYLVREPLKVPHPEAYQTGVAAITTTLHRDNPAAKLTAFIQHASGVSLPPGVNEALMVDPAGSILEGLSSNFYVLLEGKLWTAGEGVLAGITRRLVLEEAQAAGIDVHFEAPAVEAIPRLLEAFITSTSRAVLPVVSIDSQQVGSGQVGPVTRRLLALYQARIERELEEI